MLKMILLILLGLFALGVVAIAGITIWVQREAPHKRETLYEGKAQKALVLYHPSRDAHFSEDVSIAVAKGFHDIGMSVDRETMTEATAAAHRGYAFLAVITNTYYGSPDRPTLRYLERARFGNTPTIGLTLGSGTTDRAQRILNEKLRRASTNTIDVRSFWISRPNDENRLQEPNRAVAVEMARTWAKQVALNIVSKTSLSGPTATEAAMPMQEQVQ
jgi:hypothetical protein